LYIAVPPQLLGQVLWRKDDVIAARIAGQKIILERVPLEDLAKVRAPRPAQPPQNNTTESLPVHNYGKSKQER
jgi:hypothetical protein